MTKNTPEAMKKVVEKLLVDIEQIQDCSDWECEECPLWLKHIEEDPYYGKRTTCGWFLLKSVTRKIMRK